MSSAWRGRGRRQRRGHRCAHASRQRSCRTCASPIRARCASRSGLRSKRRAARSSICSGDPSQARSTRCSLQLPRPVVGAGNDRDRRGDRRSPRPRGVTGDDARPRSEDAGRGRRRCAGPRRLRLCDAALRRCGAGARARRGRLRGGRSRERDSNSGACAGGCRGARRGRAARAVAPRLGPARSGRGGARSTTPRRLRAHHFAVVRPEARRRPRARSAPAVIADIVLKALEAAPETEAISAGAW